MPTILRWRLTVAFCGRGVVSSANDAGNPLGAAGVCRGGAYSNSTMMLEIR